LSYLVDRVKEARFQPFLRFYRLLRVKLRAPAPDIIVSTLLEILPETPAAGSAHENKGVWFQPFLRFYLKN